MKSRTAPDFWKLFRGLAPDIQRKAYKSYRLWRAHPFAGTLRFKRVSEREPIYAIRIGRGYGALGLLEGDTIYWYSIGDHDEIETPSGAATVQKVGVGDPLVRQAS